MKKIYFTFSTLLASLAIVAQTAPTCSLNPTFIASSKIGVWPDSATNFISGAVGQPYVQNLTVKIPKDTVHPTFGRICFNRFEVSSTSSVTNFNLPPGLTFGSSTASLANGTVNGAPSLKFPGNSNNCASIYGTPTTAGTYTIQMQVAAFGTPSSTCSATPNASGGIGVTTQVYKYYIITIAPPVGVKEIGKDKFGVMQNQPNPFSGSTKIKYYVEDQDVATLTVYNALGAIIHQESAKTSTGENTFDVNAHNWASGMYIYTVKYKNTIDTKRLMVSNSN